MGLGLLGLLAGVGAGYQQGRQIKHQREMDELAWFDEDTSQSLAQQFGIALKPGERLPKSALGAIPRPTQVNVSGMRDLSGALASGFGNAGMGAAVASMLPQANAGTMEATAVAPTVPITQQTLPSLLGPIIARMGVPPVAAPAPVAPSVPSMFPGKGVSAYPGAMPAAPQAPAMQTTSVQPWPKSREITEADFIKGRGQSVWEDTPLTPPPFTRVEFQFNDTSPLIFDPGKAVSQGPDAMKAWTDFQAGLDAHLASGKRPVLANVTMRNGSVVPMTPEAVGVMANKWVDQPAGRNLQVARVWDRTMPVPKSEGGGRGGTRYYLLPEAEAREANASYDDTVAKYNAEQLAARTAARTEREAGMKRRWPNPRGGYYEELMPKDEAEFRQKNDLAAMERAGQAVNADLARKRLQFDQTKAQQEADARKTRGEREHELAVEAQKTKNLQARIAAARRNWMRNADGTATYIGAEGYEELLKKDLSMSTEELMKALATPAMNNEPVPPRVRVDMLKKDAAVSKALTPTLRAANSGANWGDANWGLLARVAYAEAHDALLQHDGKVDPNLRIGLTQKIIQARSARWSGQTVDPKTKAWLEGLGVWHLVTDDDVTPG